MKECLVIEATEDEIISLIQKELGLEDYDSIVDNEELGNEKWVVNVTCVSDFDRKGCIEDRSKGACSMFSTRAYLNMLCTTGFLKQGRYVIDCTW